LITHIFLGVATLMASSVYNIDTRLEKKKAEKTKDCILIKNWKFDGRKSTYL